MSLKTGPRSQNARLYYRKGQIQELYATSIAHTFTKILRLVLSSPNLRLCQLGLPSPQDIERILSWNPQQPFSLETQTCIHELVVSKAREIPDVQAVCGWDGTMSYAELDRLSNIAAAELFTDGVKSGTFVPFAYEKSIYAVIAMLGVLKAGGALVPLNLDDPAARLSEILRSVKADVVVTTDDLAPRFKALATRVVIISQGKLSVTTSKSTALICKGRPSDVMLVLFTSGSTGRPKGMVHTHASMATHALAHGTAMSYHKARVLQFAAYTFDVAIFDVFTTLIFGGCVCIPSESDRKSNIISVINEMRVDYAILTPSFAGLMDPAEVPTLKTLAVGGEALPQNRIERWAERVRLIQIYGPAEVGICLTMEMDSHTPGAVVGSPLPNSSCWLVEPDDISRLVPIGAIGELVVAGPSLALGYLNDEARTQLSFVGAPEWASHLDLPFDRFYKTGDLLRYNVDAFDGSFIFVGRKDAQIKLRGQRIEPGEVEYHIGRLPGVAFSMVARPIKGCYQEQLVAVVQMGNGDHPNARLLGESIQLSPIQSLTAEDIRQELKKILPSYMIPTECLVVHGMPFVPSLKIDRRRVYDWLTNMLCRPLPASRVMLDLLGSEESTARNLSLCVARLVEGNFEGTHLDTHDFRIQEVGLNSVKLIALTMLVQKEYGIILPMDTLLHPETTIRHLACWIESHRFPSAASISLPAQVIDAFHESQTLIRELVNQIEANIIPTGDSNSLCPSHNVLLTGASGYLGTAILHQLMTMSNSKVFILMRCENPSLGMQRIRNCLSDKRWWRSEYGSRINVWPGDLASPDLGLAKEHLFHMGALAPNNLAKPTPCFEGSRIHAVIHAGAKVHYTLPYATLVPSNINSTLTLLRHTACSSHLNTFIHVSGGETPDVDSTSTEGDYLKVLADSSGYTLTKNIAERVVRNLAVHQLTEDSQGSTLLGKNIKIVKPGYIIGSASSGFQANTTDFIWRLIAGCVEISAYNVEEQERWVYIDDAESVALRIVDCLKIPSHTEHKAGNVNSSLAMAHADSSAHVERILTGLRFGTLFETVQRVYGKRFDALPGTIWMQKLKAKAIEQGERSLLFPVLHLLDKDMGQIGVDAEPNIMNGVQGSLQEKHVEETKGMEGLVEGNLRWLIKTGILPAIDTKVTMVG